MTGEKQITDANFEAEVKKAKGLVLVDFYADWCGPCRMLAPTVKKLSEDYAGKVKVGKLDVDKNFSTAAAYSVSGIPTVILFKDGEPAERLVGLQPADVFEGVINKYRS